MSVPESTTHVNGHTTLTTIPQGPATLPEAPCSMTARVLVRAVSCESILITGRGQTGPEAARNLLESCAALKTQAAAPPPLASRTQRLSLLLAYGLEKAVGKEDWKLVERLTKAAALVLAGRVVDMGDNTAEVRSQTEPETTTYQVVGHRCTCQDAKKHQAAEQAYYCKHSCAALFFYKLAAQECG